jgi:ribonucleoside-diphosphate reductase alpha chain
MSKQGSTLAGVMDAFSVAISIGLQYGVPLETYVSKFTNMRFEPAGMTDDHGHPHRDSVMDYIFRAWRWTSCPYDRRAHLASSPPPSGPPAARRGRETGRRPDRMAAPGTGVATPAPHEARRPPSTVPARSADRRPNARGVQGKAADAPLCFTCGPKMRPAGSCYVCEGCGSTSGCS